MGSWVAPTAYLLGAGWFFATALILGILIGRWADSATGLEPIFTLVGIFVGLAVALVGGIRMLMPFIGNLGSGPTKKG
jgi:hypothetical protein